MENTTIGYLGPEHTFTHHAAELFTKKFDSVILSQKPSIDEVISELLEKEVELAVLPYVNTPDGGEYQDTRRALSECSKIEVRDTRRLRIQLAFGTHLHTSPKNITEIRSIETALAECSSYLNINYPNAIRTYTSSTTFPMKKIKESQQINIGVIGHTKAMNFYNLKILNSDVGNTKDNFTTFILLGLKN